MISPTVGRIVWFYDEDGSGPLAAIVADVHSDRLINVTAFTSSGAPQPITNVPLCQPEDERPARFYCEWMPYQVKKSFGSESGEREAGNAPI